MESRWCYQAGNGLHVDEQYRPLLIREKTDSVDLISHYRNVCPTCQEGKAGKRAEGKTLSPLNMPPSLDFQRSGRGERQENHHVPSSQDRLTGQTRSGCQTFRRAEAVRLDLFHRGEVLPALPYDHVAGRAGAVAAALMLQRDSMLQGSIQKRISLLSRNGAILRQKGQIHHNYDTI